MDKIKKAKCGKHFDVHAELCPICMIEEHDDLIRRLREAVKDIQYDREDKKTMTYEERSGLDRALCILSNYFHNELEDSDE